MDPLHPFYVYILRRPNGEPFYVGMGSNDRVHQHEAFARQGHRSHKSSLIRRIWREGGEVGKEIVERFADAASAKVAERGLIASIGRRDTGRGPLLNHTDGGDGVTGWSDDMRLAHSRRTRAAMARPEVREKVREWVSRQHADETWRANNRRRTSIYWGRPENRAAQSERTRSHAATLSAEEKSAAAAARKAGMARPEAKEKMRFAKLGKPQSKELIEKRAQANRGKKRSPETCRRISEALRAKSAARQLDRVSDDIVMGWPAC